METNTAIRFIRMQSAKWHFRIFIFAFLFGICYLIFSNLTGQIGFCLGLMLSVMLPSIAIESIRKSSCPLLFGLVFTRKMPVDILLGLAVALGNVVLMGVVAYCFSGYVVFSFPSVNDLLTLALLTLFLATFEEVLFRGEIFQAVQEKFGDILCVIVMSTVFALAHFPDRNIGGIFFMNLVIAGIMFALMFIKTKSLWLGISFHFCWNFFLYTLLGSPVSGFCNDLSVMNFGIKKQPEWLFGGAIGVEGGILVTLALAVDCWCIIKFAKPSPVISAKIFKRYYAESELIYSADKTKRTNKR